MDGEEEQSCGCNQDSSSSSRASSKSRTQRTRSNEWYNSENSTGNYCTLVPADPEPPTSTIHHRRIIPFITLPKNSAITVLVRMMTLYGMLKSGVGRLSSVVGVCSRRTGRRDRSTPCRRGLLEPPSRGGSRTTVAPGTENPRFESEGYSVYHRLADS